MHANSKLSGKIIYASFCVILTWQEDCYLKVPKAGTAASGIVVDENLTLLSVDAKGWANDRNKVKDIGGAANKELGAFYSGWRFVKINSDPISTKADFDSKVASLARDQIISFTLELPVCFTCF